MCGQDGHIHDVQSRYDHSTGVLSFVQKCAKCVWSRVIHTEDYKPEPALDACVFHMDDEALASHVKRQGYSQVAIIGRRSGKQAVRRAA